MGLLRNVLAGLLVGVGKGMEEQHKLNVQQAREDLMFRREQALKALETANRREELQLGSKLRREETSHTATEQRVTNAQEGGIRQALQDDDQAFKAQQEDIAHGRRVDLTKLEGDIQQRLIEARDAADDDEPVETVQGASGQYYHVYKGGRSKPLGIKGALPASKQEDDGTFGGRLPSRAAPAAPAAPAAEDNFAARYQSATPQTAPGLFRDGKKIPMTEAMRLYRGQ